ncbi:serine hydrolase [Oceanibaculum nanhaiense]|uniref:serine hydrolase n=1 Tax=Oceanibaculum nanhaiense TaxID=1909734 RepID=UPI003D2B120E
MIEAVDALLERWTQPGSPGCAVAVIRDGAVLHKRGYGLAHVELGVPNAPDTVFRIASITKQFTCLAVLMLARDGKLSVEDEVRQHLPELPDYGVPLRIRNLMSNTSGLRDSLEAFRLTGITLMDRRSVSEMMAIILRQEGTNFPPGSAYLYSNAGYVLLSVLIERLSGVSLRDFLQARIFGPLGMASTALLPFDAEPFPRRAQGYAPVEGALWRTGSGFEVCGEGGLVSSVEDMMTWMGIWGAGSHPHLDPLENLAQPAPLTTSGPAGGGHARYGYGLMVERYRGLSACGHSGLLPGFTSNILHIPERRLSVICLANSLGVNAYLTTRLIADLVPDMDFPEPPFAKADPTLIDRLAKAGPFVDEDSGATLTFSDSEGRLSATRFGTPFTLANSDGGMAYTVFQGGYDVVSAEVAEEPSLALRLTRIDGGIETYRPVASGPTGADLLDDYIGRYRSAELMSDWVIERAGDGLAVRIEGPRGLALPCPLEPTRPDLLTGRVGWFGAQFRDALRFHREDGRIRGFMLNASRSRGIRFVAVTN